MIENGQRYCDRCGIPLTNENNKCGFEICDKCNEILERQVNNGKQKDKNNT